MGDNLHGPTIVYTTYNIYVYTTWIIYYMGEFNLRKNESKFQVYSMNIEHR